MKKVFLVNHGTYSDYSVDAIFSSKEKADEYMRLFPRDGYNGYNDLEEMKIDPKVKYAKSGYNVYYMTMLRDGTVEKIELRDNDAKYLFSNGNKVFVWERTKAPAYKAKGVPDCLQGDIWARNEKHAIKILNDIRAQMIANGEWK